jgi:hypothetical protein
VAALAAVAQAVAGVLEVQRKVIETRSWSAGSPRWSNGRKQSDEQHATAGKPTSAALSYSKSLRP